MTTKTLTRKECALLALIGALLVWTLDTRADCAIDNFDAWKVSKALQQGMTKEDLLVHLEVSRAELDPIRMEKIQDMIEEVYQLPQSEAAAWYKAHQCEPDA